MQGITRQRVSPSNLMIEDKLNPWGWWVIAVVVVVALTLVIIKALFVAADNLSKNFWRK